MENEKWNSTLLIQRERERERENGRERERERERTGERERERAGEYEGERLFMNSDHVTSLCLSTKRWHDCRHIFYYYYNYFI